MFESLRLCTNVNLQDMASVKAYIEETVDELTNKVSWPTWGELQNSAIVVLIATMIIALIILAMDVVFSNSLEFLYSKVFR